MWVLSFLIFLNSSSQCDPSPAFFVALRSDTKRWEGYEESSRRNGGFQIEKLSGSLTLRPDKSLESGRILYSCWRNPGKNLKRQHASYWVLAYQTHFRCHQMEGKGCRFSNVILTDQLITFQMESNLITMCALNWVHRGIQKSACHLFAGDRKCLASD